MAVLDELEALYEDVTNFTERRELLEASALANLTYGEEFEDEDIEDFDFDNGEDGDGR